MSEQAPPSPHSFTPPRLHSAPSSGDGWVEDGSGAKFWGRFGAAGLLAHDPERGILLQHRANWSHFGGTWGLPGGARHEFETSVDGALREANEEAGVVVESVQLRFTSTLDLGFWSYTTVVVDVTTPFEAEVADAESIDVRWVPVDEVGGLPLHPGFGTAWPALRAELLAPRYLVVDAANVVGSRPDGWWRDRLGATNRLAERLAALSRAGFSGAELARGDRAGEHDVTTDDSAGIDVATARWWPEVVLVVEGQAVDAAVSEPQQTETSKANGGGVRVVPSPHGGDQQIVDTVTELLEQAPTGVAPRVGVVTADRELRGRVRDLGATVSGPGWLLGLLEPGGAAAD